MAPQPDPPPPADILPVRTRNGVSLSLCCVRCVSASAGCCSFSAFRCVSTALYACFSLPFVRQHSALRSQGSEAMAAVGRGARHIQHHMQGAKAAEAAGQPLTEAMFRELLLVRSTR